MARVTRKNLRAALAAQEFAEAMSYSGTPEGWEPFLPQAFALEVLLVPAETGEEIGGLEQSTEGGIIRTRFDSVRDFCASKFMLPANKERCEREFITAKGKFIYKEAKSNLFWYGAETAEEAMRRATSGWVEGAQKALRLANEMDVTPPASLRRKLERADQGDALDIHAVYRGGIDRAWERRRRRHSRGRMTVRIVSQVNILSNVSAEQLFWKGAASIKLCDLLSAAGYSVEVIGAVSSSSSTKSQMKLKVLTTFTIKEASAPLNVEQFAGVACNAGFHRTFGFRSYYAVLPVRKNLSGGADFRSDEEVMKTAGLAEDGTKAFLSDYNINSKERAEAWIAKCLQELEESNTF